MSELAKQNDEFKKMFDKLVEDKIHELNPVIFSINDKDQQDKTRQITRNFLDTPQKYRQNVLILCYESDKDYYPIFLNK